MGPIPPKGTPERTAWFVELASRRKDRQEPRPTPRDGRTRMFVAGSPEEEHWERRARTLGLSDEGMTRQGWRRLVFRLAAADAAHVAELVNSGVPLDPSADLLTFFLEREAVRLRDRARRDRAIADAHDKAADQAETRLVQHLRATKGKKR